MDVVSVPSRGLRYLNELMEKVNGFLYGFRPLTGIKVSEHDLTVSSMSREYGSFRPLTGIKVSERKSEEINKTFNYVSVPSRGLRYLN